MGTKLENGHVARAALSTDMTRDLRLNLRLSSEYLASLTFEKRKSEYPDAKFDYLFFDKDGAAVIEGRQFGGGVISFWKRTQQLPSSS